MPRLNLLFFAHTLFGFSDRRALSCSRRAPGTRRVWFGRVTLPRILQGPGSVLLSTAGGSARMHSRWMG